MSHGDLKRHSSSVEILVLGPTDRYAAASILARAFDQEPAKLRIMPNASVRRTILERTLRARLYDPLRYGFVHGARIGDELAAIAVWYPPCVPTISPSAALRAVPSLPFVIWSFTRGLPHMVRMLLSDVRGAIALSRHRRPAVARAAQGITWRLDLLGTLPEHRGRGLARALLERQLHQCDQDGAAVWLEATDPVNPEIYERFGFRTIKHIDGPSWLLGYWVMRREPHAAKVRN